MAFIKLSRSALKQKLQKHTLKASAGIVSLAALTGGASAEFNTSAITSVLDGMITILPSMTNVVTEIVPMILTLSVLGFIVGFWDKILGIFDKFFR